MNAFKVAFVTGCTRKPENSNKTSDSQEIQKKNGVVYQDPISLFLDKTIKQSEYKNEINAEYLIELVKKSGLSLEAVKKIISSDSKGIYRLWLVSLFLKIKNHHQMNNKYAGFQNKILELLQSNKIKITLSNPGDSRVIARAYNSATNEIYLGTLPKSGEEILKFETDIVHELFHAYQDYRKIKSSSAQIEGEAYLAGFNYLYSAYPDRTNNSWVYPVWNGNRFDLYFSIPKQTIAKLFQLNENSAEYVRLFENVKKRYKNISTYFFISQSDQVKSVGNEIVADLRRQGATLNKLANLETIRNLLKGNNQYFKEIEPFKITHNENNGHFSCPYEFAHVAATVEILKEPISMLYRITKDKSVQTEFQKLMDDFINIYLSKAEVQNDGKKLIIQGDGIK